MPSRPGSTTGHGSASGSERPRSLWRKRLLRWQVEFKDAFQECDVSCSETCLRSLASSVRSAAVSGCYPTVAASSMRRRSSATYCPSRFLLNPRSWATSAMVWPESITLWRLRPCIGRKRFALAGHEDLLPAEPSVPPARYPPSGVNPRAFQRG